MVDHPKYFGAVFVLRVVIYDDVRRIGDDQLACPHYPTWPSDPRHRSKLRDPARNGLIDATSGGLISLFEPFDDIAMLAKRPH
jgi:hypothetical protein